MKLFFLYVAGDGSSAPIKIGVSNDPKKRVKQLQTNCPFKLVVLHKWRSSFAFELERIAHYELRDHRMSGEWFSCTLEMARTTIDEIISRTNGGKDLAFYKEKDEIVKSISAQKAGLASAKKAKAISLKAVAKIKDRWPLPSKEWPTAQLLKEACVSLNTAKAHLGKRPIAQYNYQAAQKRKARKEAGRV